MCCMSLMLHVLPGDGMLYTMTAVFILNQARIFVTVSIVLVLVAIFHAQNAVPPNVVMSVGEFHFVGLYPNTVSHKSSYS